MKCWPAVNRSRSPEPSAALQEEYSQKAGFPVAGFEEVPVIGNPAFVFFEGNLWSVRGVQCRNS